jgi:phage FluMu protein Com
MSDFYRCFKCNSVVSHIASSKKKCPSCGSTKGEVLSQDRFNEGFTTGVFIKTGPKIGKRP